jgi:hypothetical protein
VKSGIAEPVTGNPQYSIPCVQSSITSYGMQIGQNKYNYHSSKFNYLSFETKHDIL